MIPAFISESDYQLERELAVRRVRLLMSLHAVTSEELTRDGAPQASSKGRLVVPDGQFLKYYDIRSRRGWNGQGPQPDWLRDVVLGEGRGSVELSKAARAKLLDLYLNNKLKGAQFVE